MLNCKQASELMSRSMDTKLPFGKRMSLRFHLIMCHGCTNFLSQIFFLRKAAKHFESCGHCEALRLSDEAKKRIHKAMQAQDKSV